MSACLNRECRTELGETWLFCPKCGMDNRPPYLRKPIHYCQHDMQGLLPYCPLCGWSEEYGSSNKFLQASTDRKLGIRLLIFALASLFVAVIIELIVRGQYGAFQVVADQQAAGRTLDDPLARPRMQNLVSPIFGLGAAVLFVWGAILLIRANKAEQTKEDL